MPLYQLTTRGKFAWICIPRRGFKANGCSSTMTWNLSSSTAESTFTACNVISKLYSKSSGIYKAIKAIQRNSTKTVRLYLFLFTRWESWIPRLRAKICRRRSSVCKNRQFTISHMLRTFLHFRIIQQGGAHGLGSFLAQSNEKQCLSERKFEKPAVNLQFSH